MRAPQPRPVPPAAAAAPRRTPAGTPPAPCSPATCPCARPHPLQAQRTARRRRRRRRSCCYCRCCLRSGWQRCCCWHLRGRAQQRRRRQACQPGPDRVRHGVRMYGWRTLPARRAPLGECAAASKLQGMWDRVSTSAVLFIATVMASNPRPGAKQSTLAPIYIPTRTGTATCTAPQQQLPAIQLH